MSGVFAAKDSSHSSAIDAAILHAEDFIKMRSFARFVTRAKRLSDGGMNRERDQINTKPWTQASMVTSGVLSCTPEVRSS